MTQGKDIQCVSKELPLKSYTKGELLEAQCSLLKYEWF